MNKDTKDIISQVIGLIGLTLILAFVYFAICNQKARAEVPKRWICWVNSVKDIKALRTARERQLCPELCSSIREDAVNALHVRQHGIHFPFAYLFHQHRTPRGNHSFAVS